MSINDVIGDDDEPTGMGHNTKNASILRDYIRRVENLEQEKEELSQDIRDLYKEAKQNGFDPTVMRAIVRLRKKDQEKLKEFETALDLYKHAMGMI